MPNLSEFSICFWYETNKEYQDGVQGTILSYTHPKNSITIIGELYGDFQVILSGKIAALISNQNLIPMDRFGIPVKQNNVQICIAAGIPKGEFIEKKVMRIFVNGELKNQTDVSFKEISGGGELVLGQDQDCSLGCYSAFTNFEPAPKFGYFWRFSA